MNSYSSTIFISNDTYYNIKKNDELSARVFINGNCLIV